MFRSIQLFIVCALIVSGARALAADYTVLDRIVAVVNDDVITDTELTERLTSITLQLKQNRDRLPPADILRRQVLERLIVERLQLQLAESTGIRVDDDTLNSAIRRIADENKLSLAQFRSVLENDGYDFVRFREDIRREIIIRRLHERQIAQRIVVTEQDVDQFLKSRADLGASGEYHLAHILIALPDAASPEQIDAARKKIESIVERLKAGEDFEELAIAFSDGQQALEGGDLGWRAAAELPTLFSAIVPTMTIGDVSDVIRGANGFHLIKVLDRRGETRHFTAQTKVRHILIKPTTVRSTEEIVNTLKTLRENVITGEADFASLAKEYSDDAGSAVDGGSLNWVKPGDTVPPFEATMDNTAIGNISEPFESQFGWHILMVEDRRNYDDTEEFQRQQARQHIRQTRIEEETESWLRRLRDEAFVDLHFVEN